MICMGEFYHLLQVESAIQEAHFFMMLHDYDLALFSLKCFYRFRFIILLKDIRLLPSRPPFLPWHFWLILSMLLFIK
jgi:hypothetical protein